MEFLVAASGSARPRRNAADTQRSHSKFEEIETQIDF
jgi:hypothetical protein